MYPVNIYCFQSPWISELFCWVTLLSFLTYTLQKNLVISTQHLELQIFKWCLLNKSPVFFQFSLSNILPILALPSSPIWTVLFIFQLAAKIMDLKGISSTLLVCHHHLGSVFCISKTPWCTSYKNIQYTGYLY